MTYHTKFSDDNVANLLIEGGIGVLPTDTIYGLSARALNETAVKRIYQLKERDQHKPFIVLISERKQLELLGIESRAASLVDKYWPGPLSVIFESSNIPAWLQQGTQSLAVRLPNHQALLELIAKVGPIISTSANLQGQEPAKNIQQAISYFGYSLDFYVDAGELAGSSSTLVRITDGQLEVLRQGALKLN